MSEEEINQGERILFDLGYIRETKVYPFSYQNYYKYDEDNNYIRICFHLEDKSLEKIDSYEINSEITMAELKAINLICEGLGWLDE